MTYFSGRIEEGEERREISFLQIIPGPLLWIMMIVQGSGRILGMLA